MSFGGCKNPAFFQRLSEGTAACVTLNTDITKCWPYLDDFVMTCLTANRALADRCYN